MLGESHVKRNATGASTLPSWASSSLVFVGVVCVTAVIWSLVEQNRQLREAIGSRPAVTNGVAPGDFLTAEEVVLVTGSPVHLPDLIGEGGVIAFMTTTCKFCEATIPFWDELADQLAEHSIGFVAVSLHDHEITRRYAEMHGIDWPILSALEPSAFSAMGVRRVPVLIAVEAGGEVAEVWSGQRRVSEVDEVLLAIIDHVGNATDHLGRKED